MIYESSFWKNDLRRRAECLRKRLAQRRWTEASFARLEQDVMLGFFSIRKLMESRKLTTELEKSSLSIVAYEPTGKPVTYLNRSDLEVLYKLTEPAEAALKLRCICNQFIHSYIFQPVLGGDDRLQSIRVSSDKWRGKALYELDAADIAALFGYVAKDHPAHLAMRLEKGDYVAVREKGS